MAKFNTHAAERGMLHQKNLPAKIRALKNLLMQRMLGEELMMSSLENVTALRCCSVLIEKTASFISHTKKQAADDPLRLVKGLKLNLLKALHCFTFMRISLAFFLINTM